MFNTGPYQIHQKPWANNSKHYCHYLNNGLLPSSKLNNINFKVVEWSRLKVLESDLNFYFKLKKQTFLCQNKNKKNVSKHRFK